MLPSNRERIGYHTHAHRIFVSSKLLYASYLIVGGSRTLRPCSSAYFTSLFDGIGRVGSVDALLLVCAEARAGRRNGRTPVGEAWLFEDTRSWSMPAILRKVYSSKALAFSPDPVHEAAGSSSIFPNSLP
jgi:hypothetical protein